MDNITIWLFCGFWGLVFLLIFTVEFSRFISNKKDSYYHSARYKKSKEFKKYHQSYYGEPKKNFIEKRKSIIYQHASIYTQDYRIDNITNKILAKVLRLAEISTDIHIQLKLDKIKNIYLPRIISAYKNIPLGQREAIVNGASAYSMVVEQLNTIYKGLDEMESDILLEKHHALRVNDKILKQVFHSNEMTM